MAAVMLASPQRVLSVILMRHRDVGLIDDDAAALVGLLIPAAGPDRGGASDRQASRARAGLARMGVGAASALRASHDRKFLFHRHRPASKLI